ncbi:hypothetical protein FOA52_011196 [Chlamydomonas sp. UWO 241]|nr:hypothetical protein FOA52_011196 [Chlamydomonas sp. UWO 241]
MGAKDKGKGKGGAKQMVQLAQLTALHSTYKAASRRYGVVPIKEVAALIEESIQDTANIAKVSLSGPDVTFGELAAVLDCMAGYAPVKNLCLWSCNVGDKGMVALGTLLKAASSDKWWRGSKIKHLEVCGDGLGLKPEQWNERYMAHVNGELPTLGRSMQLPNLVLGQAEVVTPDTLKMQDQELPLSWVPPVHDTPPPAALAGFGDDEGEDEEGGGGGGDDDNDDEDEGEAEGGGGAPAAEPSGPAAAAGSDADSDGERGRGGAGSGGADTPGGPSPASAATAGSAAARAAASAAAASGSAARAAARLALARDADGRLSSTFVAAASMSALTYAQGAEARQLRAEAGHAERRALGLPPAPGAPGAPLAARGALPTAALPAGLGGLFAAPPVPGSGGGFAAAEAGGGASTSGGGGAPWCASAPSFRQPRPMAWSPAALRSFSIGLSTFGCTLQVLALDHNELGNVGVRVLSQGLKRCMSLQHLSLEDCGIGPVGAAALAEAMMPDESPQVAALQPRLLALNLSRNPLGGAGLSALCNGLDHASALMVLNLAATELTAVDVPALKRLAGVLLRRQNIDQVDLDANFFGDVGAAAFIPFLAEAKYMRKFRVTGRGMSRAVGGAIAEILKDNHPKKGGKKKKGAGKKQ